VFHMLYRTAQSTGAHRTESVSVMGHELTLGVSSTGSDQKQQNIFGHISLFLIWVIHTVVTVKNCRLVSTANHIQYKYKYYARYARDLTMAAAGHAYGMVRAAPGMILNLFKNLPLRIAIVRSAWRQPNISKHTSTVSCDLVLKIFLNVLFMT